MSWLLWIVGGLLAVAVAVYAIGWTLPADHVARAERVVAAPLETVARRIRDVRGYERWRKVKVEVLSEAAGRVRYRETSGGEAITFELVEDQEARTFTSTILDQDLPFDGTWTIALGDASGGTLVAIEERGRVKSALYRFVSRFVFGHTGTMEAYLDALSTAGSARAGAYGAHKRPKNG